MIPTDKIPELEDVGKIVDDVVSTGEERDAMLTQRHQIDVTSPFKLPHLIRPIVALVLLTLQIAVFIADVFGVVIAWETVASIASLNAAAIGYYFNSRKNEKVQQIQAKASIAKAEAAIEIEEIRARHEIKQDKKDARIERRQKRRASRVQ